MAAIKASVNVFALLDGDDPGDKRLADLDPKHKDEPKKKPLSAAACDYKLKLMKPPAPAAGSKAPRRNPPQAVATGLRSTAAAHMVRAMHKQTTTPAPPPARSTKLAGVRSAVATSTAKAVNKKTTTPTALPARSTNYTALLFGKAYPSTRERIFKQRQERQEEWERRQAAEAAENGRDHGKTAAAEPAGAAKEPYGKGQKEEAPAPVPAPATTPVVAVKTSPPPPPPRLQDIDQFPSLKLG